MRISLKFLHPKTPKDIFEALNQNDLDFVEGISKQADFLGSIAIALQTEIVTTPKVIPPHSTYPRSSTN